MFTIMNKEFFVFLIPHKRETQDTQANNFFFKKKNTHAIHTQTSIQTINQQKKEKGKRYDIFFFFF